MKLNLPTTLTSQKISSLLLLTLLQVKDSEAGNAFKNCLTAIGDTTSYNNLLSYPFPAGELGETPSYQLVLCCNGSQCQLGITCTNFFVCARVGGKITCRSRAGSCVGIIGNEPITTSTTDRQDDSYCANSSVSIVTPLTNCLKTDTPDGLEQGYARYSVTFCPPSEHGLWDCSWDNQGITCTNIHVCWLQFPFTWPGSADKNPSTYIYTPTSTQTSIATSTTTSATLTPTNLTETNDNSAEKIWIPVGSSITGTGIIGGLTYYYCKKKRNRKKNNLTITTNQEAEDNNNLKIETIELKERELPVINEEITTIKAEVQEISEETNELATLTPPSSPLPYRSPQQFISIDPKEQLLIQLKNKLVGQEQLWSDYLEVNQLLMANPTSQFITNNFNNLQNQLLQFLTIGEITLLLENQNINQVRSPQTEYTEFIEVARSPQVIRYGSPQQWN